MSYGVRNRIQAECFFYALGAGFLIGLLYAVLLVLRKIIKHGDVAVMVEDVLFCIIAALLSFIFFLDFNNGSIRCNLLAAELIGFLAVRAAAVKILSKFNKKRLQDQA